MSISPPISDLKLTRVTLFKVGIGSFQKKGHIDLQTTKQVKLSFKNTVMNDLLKTFSLLRVNGDLMVKGISYEAKDTNKEKLLEDSFINLPQDNALTAFFKQTRGVAVKLKLFDKTIEGKVLGLQIFEEAPTGKAIIPQEYLLLAVDEGKVQPIRVNEIIGVEMLDPDVDRDFKFFLETITGGSKDKNKTITLFLEGKEQSEFLLNFLQEVPAWKVSFRLFVNTPKELEKAEKAEKAEKSKDNQEKEFDRDLQIQGWAIIDNVLDEDWENVDLTLVTGLPVSFIYDSYTPAWIMRPTIERKKETGAKVVQFDRSRKDLAGKPSPKAKARYDMPCSTSGGMPCPPPGAPMAFAAAPAPMMMKEMAKSEMFMETADMDRLMMEEEPMLPAEPESTFEAGTVTEKGKGLAFKYHIKTPVNVKRNNSSLIPILQSDLKGVLVSVYNYDVNTTHPLHTISFTNSSGLTLEEGPISVFLDGVFAGEAMLPFLEPNGECRIPYAVDQGIEIIRKTENYSKDYHSIEIGRDIYKKYFRLTEHVFDIQNYSETSRRIILEHPRDVNAELIDTDNPTEKTPNVYRFFFDIEPETKTKFKITERRVDRTYEQSQSLRRSLIDEWLKAKLIGTEEHAYLLKLIEFNEKTQKLQSDFNILQTKVNSIFDEQSRIRANLLSLRDSTSEKNLRDRYVAKFDERETELEGIEAEQAKLQKEMNENQQALTQLTFDWLAKKKSEKENK